MKKLMFFILYFYLLTPLYASNEVFIKAHNALISIEDEEKNTKKAIEILSAGLLDDPFSITLLTFRAQLNTTLGEFDKAYQDIKIITRLKPKASSYKFWECTFIEKFNGATNSTIECYKKTAELVAAELGDKKETDLGYIYVLLMAENPQGQILADRFLETLTNSTEDQFYRELLENFDRRNSLPKTGENETVNW